MADTAILVDPTTNLPLSLVLAAGGATSAGVVGAQSNCATASGAVTVRAPAPSAEGNVFAVFDSDTNAAVNAVTVDGNGFLIDGAATFVLSVSGGYACFMFDRGQWRRIAPRRLAPNGSIVELVADLPGGGLSVSPFGSSLITSVDAAAARTLLVVPSTAATVAAIIASRLTPLDVNHIHAWELTEAAGAASFADTGSSAQKVSLVIANTANVQLGLPGLLGACPFFGMQNPPAAAVAASAKALVSAFNDLPATGFTIEYWLAPATSENVATIACFDCGGTGGGNLSLQINRAASGDNLSATVRANAFTTPTSQSSLFKPSLSQARFSHYAFSYDGASVFMYANGELVGKSAATGPIQWTNTAGAAPQISIGDQVAGGAALDGCMSRVRMSNVVRSQAYLRSVYAKAMLIG